MNLAKDDSYISSKEDGLHRVLSLVTAYRAHAGLREWDHEASDGENHDIVAAELPHDKHGKRKKTEAADDDGTQIQKSGTFPLL